MITQLQSVTGAHSVGGNNLIDDNYNGNNFAIFGFDVRMIDIVLIIIASLTLNVLTLSISAFICCKVGILSNGNGQSIEYTKHADIDSESESHQL